MIAGRSAAEAMISAQHFNCLDEVRSVPVA